ncbi:MAG: signal peptidase I [Sulfolobales archaeon]|nr:signal peptidase I [Sulfolobales archaeon]MCX8208292.1 signal peptidase I [Sulfolobales archaeon]MDW8010116.1 signal peptidase I [Sulfolobales archaeon]
MAAINKATALAIEALVVISLLVLVALILLDHVALAVVEGTSMEPTLQPGDLVIIVKRVSPREISVGDVIVYRRGRNLIIHRVIKVEGSTLITKGDNNWLPDAPISYQVVVGRVLEVGGRVVKIPLIGYLSLFIRYLITSFTNLPVVDSLSSVAE